MLAEQEASFRTEQSNGNYRAELEKLPFKVEVLLPNEYEVVLAIYHKAAAKVAWSRPSVEICVANIISLYRKEVTLGLFLFQRQLQGNNFYIIN